MKKIAWILLLMIWVILAAVGNAQEMTIPTAQWEQEIKETDLYAQAVVLMDAQTGRVLYGKNEEQILAMASTTKIMTCIVTLEQAEWAEIVEISGYAAGMPEVKLGVRKGERYLLKDLLYSLMLESHNDVAVAIAEHIGGKLLQEELCGKSVSAFSMEESKQAVAAFADLMNEKAKELGCENTWFITPNGLDAEEKVLSESGEDMEKFHSTTAEDLAKIMSYCVLHSPKTAEFLDITGTPSYIISGENGRMFHCYNHNAFLNMMSGAISGKTGFTNRAGYCYVGALEDGGRTFVVALLACGWPYNKSYKWADTRKLMEYGIEHYHYRSFLDDSVIFDKKWLEPIRVANGQTSVLGEDAYVEVEVYSGEEAQIDGMLMRTGEEIVVQYEQESILAAPVEEGSIVGSVCYMVDGISYRTEDIRTKENVKKIDFKWCLRQILERFLLKGQYVGE